MAFLCFGLAISNYRYTASRLGINPKIRIDKQRLREFHEEIAFVIKSFFFVYIGLLVSFTMESLFLGLGVLAVIVLIRFFVVLITGNLLLFIRQEKAISQVVYVYGLPALVMSQLPSIFDPYNRFFMRPEIYPELSTPIVLGTIIYSTLASFLVAKYLLTKGENLGKKK